MRPKASDCAADTKCISMTCRPFAVSIFSSGGGGGGGGQKDEGNKSSKYYVVVVEVVCANKCRI
jgi:hypothetical protein